MPGRITRRSVNQGSGNKVLEEPGVAGQKRFVSHSPVKEAPKAKRTALGDITNVADKKQAVAKKTQQQEGQLGHRPVTRSISDKRRQGSQPVQSTGITPLQESLKATKIQDTSVHDEIPTLNQEWIDIDAQERDNANYPAEYAVDIFKYMKEREVMFSISDVLAKQPEITSDMRTILIDWMIELQENFELYHETLYLSVKLVDLYLSRKTISRENLQLLGATAMLIASKFEELCPPLIDDFIYLCADAYDSSDMRVMEKDILKTIDYDINIPIAYRFLRRYAKAANIGFDTHTLARYICESALQVHEFVHTKASNIAAAAMYLALRMKKVAGWSPTLQHYTEMSLLQLLPLVKRLNVMLKTPWKSNLTVRTKYSHEVFCCVAKIAPLDDVDKDAASLL